MIIFSLVKYKVLTRVLIILQLRSKVKKNDVEYVIAAGIKESENRVQIPVESTGFT